MNSPVLKHVKTSAVLAAGALALSVLAAAPAIATDQAKGAQTRNAPAAGPAGLAGTADDDRDGDNDRYRSRDHDKDRDKDRDRHRDHDRDHDHGRDRDKDHDKDRDKNRDKDSDRDHKSGKVVAKTGVNIRKHPDTWSKILGSFRNGAIIKLKCKVRGQDIHGNDRWYKLAYRDGWVAARWVKNLDDIPWCYR